MNWVKKALLVTVVVMGAAIPPAFGEYYQYTDANGVQRFTDDISTVPAPQRTNVKTHQSIKSVPVQLANRNQQTGTESLDNMPSSEDAPLQTGTWGEKIDRQTNELDRMQLELAKTYRSLQTERDALAAKAPPAGASAEARAAYRRQVDKLNQKIGDYDARYAKFREKEKAFNDRYRK